MHEEALALCMEEHQNRQQLTMTQRVLCIVYMHPLFHVYLGEH